jgi:DNA invertase Pin-like site-specific DNA recombinase
MYNLYDFSNISPDEILVYLRKSRTDDPDLSVEEVLKRHETTLDEWSERYLGRKIPDCNKIKEVVSGETIDSRPGFLYLLKQIEHPDIKAVLVKDCARLGRPDLEEIGRISKLFRFTSTIVITPERTFDVKDEWQRESFERELMKSNEVLNYYKKIQQAGRERSCADGWFIGSIAPYGYDKIVVRENNRKCHTLAINEEQAEVVRMIFDMYVNKDMGYWLICNQLDELGIKPPKGQHWSPHGLRDMLQNPSYTGKVRWNWRKTVTIVEDSEIKQTRPKAKYGDYLIYDGKHEAIISEELFQAALDKNGRNHRAKPSTKIRNPLAGLVYCQCGRAMSLRTYKNPDGKEKSAPRLLCDDQTHCNTGSCLYSEMIDIVIDILRQKISDYEVQLQSNNDDVVVSHQRLIKNLEKKLSVLEDKEIAQWEAQADPDPANRMPPHIFKKLNEKLLKEKEDVEKALKNAIESAPEPTNYEQRIVTLQDALNALQDDEVSAAEKNKFLKRCIDRIEYKREKPQRLKNPEKRTKKNGRDNSRKLKPNPLPTGGSWTNTPIEISVKLNV